MMNNDDDLMMIAMMILINLICSDRLNVGNRNRARTRPKWILVHLMVMMIMMMVTIMMMVMMGMVMMTFLVHSPAILLSC